MCKRAVITGVTGAVGMALLEKYKSEGWEVLAVCRKGSARNSRIAPDPKITVAETDISRLDQLETADPKPYGVFYHLAWGGTFGAGREDLALQYIWPGGSGVIPLSGQAPRRSTGAPTLCCGRIQRYFRKAATAWQSCVPGR